MASFTHRTALADVDYTLYRRRTGGVWHYRFWFKGIPHRNTTKSSDLSAAKTTTTSEIEKAVGAFRLGGKALTLSAAVEDYKNERWPEETRKHNRSYNGAKHRLANLCKNHRGAVTLDMSEEVFRLMVQKFIDERKKEGNSAVTLSNDQRSISRLCSWLMARKQVTWTANPARRKGLELPPIPKTIKRSASDADTERMMDHALYADMVIFPVLVLMQSALRPVGCCRVLWQHIHLDGKPTIEVHREKQAGREIPLSAWAVRQLKKWLAKHPAEPEQRVFPFGVDVAHKHIRWLRTQVGVEGFTLGAVRRLSYRRLYEADVSPQIAAKIMGNSIATALKYYVDLETLNAEKEVAALAPPRKTSTKTSTKRKKKRPK